MAAALAALAVGVLCGWAIVRFLGISLDSKPAALSRIAHVVVEICVTWTERPQTQR